MGSPGPAKSARPGAAFIRRALTGCHPPGDGIRRNARKGTPARPRMPPRPEPGRYPMKKNFAAIAVVMLGAAAFAQTPPAKPAAKAIDIARFTTEGKMQK